jgi:hypothetical protein
MKTPFYGKTSDVTPAPRYFCRANIFRPLAVALVE